MSEVRIVFQESNGLYPVGEHTLTDNELDALVSLMPDSRWIIVRRKIPQDYSDILITPESIVNYSALSDDTLRKIAAEQPLHRDGFDDVVNNITN